MRYTKKGPCEHFDVKENSYKVTCTDHPDNPDNKYGPPCDHYMENASGEDYENGDINRVCREHHDVPEDTQTADMFKEAQCVKK